MRENTKRNTRESLNQHKIVTHVLDSRVHKRSHDPRTTKGDTKVVGLLRKEVLKSTRGSSLRGVLNPKGSSLKRGRGLSRGVDPMWMSNALSLI